MGNRDYIFIKMFIISLSTYDFHLHYYDQDHFDVDNDANCNEHIEGTEALCGIAAVLIRMMVATNTMTKMTTMVLT